MTLPAGSPGGLRCGRTHFHPQPLDTVVSNDAVILHLEQIPRV